MRRRPAISGEKLANRYAPFNAGARRGVSAAAALLLFAAPSAAQSGSWVLPGDVPSFEFPLASPRASALVGRVVHLSRNETRFGREWEAEPALGEILPLFALRRGAVPITLHLGAQVYGRYSLGDAASAQISNDWHVNLIATAAVAPWELALELYHESNHLGDEYADRFGAARVNWSRGIVGAWAGYDAGAVTLRANASYALVDAVHLPRAALAVAADYLGRSGRFLGAPAAPVMALHADAQAYNDWRPTYSGRAGIRFAEAESRRGLALLFTFLSGQSTQRQFYAGKSRYVGMEVRLDL